jgi:hypothetical protein
LDRLIAYFTPLSQNWRVAAYRHVSAQALYKEAFKGAEKELAGIRNIPGDPQILNRPCLSIVGTTELTLRRGFGNFEKETLRITSS